MKSNLHRFIVLSFFLHAACSAIADVDRPANFADEGHIRIYSSLEVDQIERYLFQFSAQYPNIDVSYERLSDGEIVSRLTAERDNPRADVVWAVGRSNIHVLESAGLLIANKPRGYDRIGSAFRDAQDPPEWIGLHAWMVALCVNPQRLAPLDISQLTSWDSLKDPLLQGKIVAPNPETSGTGYEIAGATLQRLGMDAGWQYLSELDRNISSYTRSGAEPCRRVTAPGSSAAIGISYDYVAVTAGAAVRSLFLQNSGYEVGTVALTPRSLPNAPARTFESWSLSEDAMNLYSQDFSSTAAPANPLTRPGFPPFPESYWFPIDFKWMSANRALVISEWKQRFEAKVEP
jgi:iron(III) transport system substrate-binding protein